MSGILKAGKLPSALLNSLLSKLPQADASVLIGPGMGLDSAAIQTQQNRIGLAMDPITFTSHRLGYYSICINLNDLICQGVKAKWVMSTLLLPEGFFESDLSLLWDDFCRALKQFELLAVGGHIEVTTAVNHPILIAQLMGEPIGSTFLTPKNIQVGDRLLLWQSAGIEGTAILAREHTLALQSVLSSDELMQVESWIENPGICIEPFAKKLLTAFDLIALHDPTEGGVATAIHEMADACGLGVNIQKDAIWIRPQTQKICDYFNINPLGLLSSGSLLMACSEKVSAQLQKQFSDVPLREIGVFTQGNQRIINSPNPQALPRFDRDELLRAL